MALHPDQWLKPAGAGRYCAPGGLHIDSGGPGGRALIPPAHSDHARPGHARVLATPGTLAIMRNRYGEGCADVMQTVEYGERVKQGEVTVWLAPAGHVLGSAQVVMEYGGSRAVVSGDYKRRF